MPHDPYHRALEGRAPRTQSWLRAMGAFRDPPLPKPRAPRLDPIRRTWPGAFWHARIAVQAGVTLDDFLRSRLARYLAILPVSRARLPVGVEVEDGQLVVRPAAPAALPVAPAPGDWLAPLLAVDGPPARREVDELEARLAVLEGEIASARRRTDERARQLAADVAVGLVPGPPEVEATAEQLGRPPIRSGAPRTLTIGFTVAALSAETWQVALPLLAGAGIDPAALRAEALRAPADVALAAAFALAVATGIFALVHAGVETALALFRGDADERRRRWLASATLAAGGGAAVLATAVAALPGPAAARLPAVARVLLLLAVPLAVSLVRGAARRDEEARAADEAAALAWDRERARALGERTRRLDELRWAEDEVQALEERRDEARRRLRALGARAAQAARLAAEADRLERDGLSRLARSLVAAVELDRYEFVRQASARGAHDLLFARRRKPADPAAPAPVPPPEGPEPHLEPVAGRIAS